MKITSILFLIILASCSSKDKNAKVEESAVTFKKPKILKLNEVPDFYLPAVSSSRPALQDETLDRFDASELDSVANNQDPLIQISVACTQSRFDEAFKLASKIYDSYQKIPQYWNLIANCHLNQGSSRKALLFYNKALEASANYVPALNNIGVMYSRQGQEQKALVAFERANKFSKFSKTPRYNLAKTYLRYGLAQSALPLFQGLSNASPKDVDMLNALASTYFLLSDYQKALETYNKMPRQFWSNPEIGLNLAMTLKKINRLSDAKKVFAQVSSPTGAELENYYRTIDKQLGDSK